MHTVSVRLALQKQTFPSCNSLHPRQDKLYHTSWLKTRCPTRLSLNVGVRWCEHVLNSRYTRSEGIVIENFASY